ncbi:MAG: metallophosphoesterase [Candidatus Riflebacteria bacterium]|nr:metallophosphoesterase [Candidatus Riflebacteria bacterium]
MLETTKLILTSDLHQWITKWKELIGVVAEVRPRFVLVAGDLLPKHGGHAEQRGFFPALRRYLVQMREAAPVTVLLFLGNDDHHILEPLLDELASEGLCVNLAGRVYRESGLVFCGMNKVRDHPFGYKHWCARDGDFTTCPTQFCGQGLTLDETGAYVPLPSLEQYLAEKPSLGEELERVAIRLEDGEMDRSIWMVHQPPAALGMDLCGHGERVGSPTLLDFIREKQPLLGLSGHIHESPHQPGGAWAARVGRTWWFQPGQLDRRFHYVLAELDGGLQLTSARHSLLGEFGP